MTNHEKISAQKIKIAIADDHPIYRDGIIEKLKGADRFIVAFEAKDGIELMEKLKTHQISILLLDNMMPNMSGLEAMDLIKVCYPSLKVILISATDHYFSREILDDFGIDEAILKIADKTELTELLLKVHKNDKRKAGLLSLEPTERATFKKFDITKKERALLKLLEENKTDEEIANELKITKRTVETHRSNILKRTGSNNLVAALRKVFWWLK